MTAVTTKGETAEKSAHPIRNPDPLLIVDSHLDLAFSALQLNRDLTHSVTSVRAHEPEPVMRSYGSCTVTFPELRRGRVGLVFGTVMTRIDPKDLWTQTGMYAQSQCYAVGRGHFAYYQAMERTGVLRLVRDTPTLDEVTEAWRAPGSDPADVPAGDKRTQAGRTSMQAGRKSADPPVGLVLAMEGADSILSPEQVSEWYGWGLRMVSISHYGTSSYAHGTGTEGGLLDRAKPLLRALNDKGIIVDLTHLSDQAFWEVLDAYDGPVAASHHNCRSLVPGQRQLNDDMIRAIVERDGVIGISADSWMLDPAWRRNLAACDQQSHATIETMIDHMDHIAGLAGNSRHVGIGSDLDGGFGQEQAPRDLNTIADLQKLRPLLERRGYTAQDIGGIFSENWIRLLRNTWS